CYLFARYGDPRVLHSFPTRRSSDLVGSPARGGVVGVSTRGGGPSEVPGGNGWGGSPTLPRMVMGGLNDAWRTWPSAVGGPTGTGDRKSTRLNSSHDQISYAVFCLKK